MEGSCSTGQSPQWTVVPVEEEEEEELLLLLLLFLIIYVSDIMPVFQ
jgi:hypothetical protein